MGEKARVKTEIFGIKLWLQREKSRRSKQGMVLAALLVLVLLMNVLSGKRFLTIANIKVVVTRAVIPTFLVWGICFVFLSGMIDLSVGAVLILASNVAGFFGLRFGYLGLIAGGLATAVLLEFINCQVFLRTGIPTWVGGLGMAMIYESIGSLYSSYALRSGGNIVSLGPNLRELGYLPYNLLFLIGGFVLAYSLFNYTLVGLNARAVGSNENIAQMMGVNTYQAKLLGMVVGGIFIGLGAAVNESYVGRILPLTGLGSVGLIFESLAALLIAKAISGVFNIIFGAIIGTISLAALFNFLTIMGVPSGTWQEVVLGLSVILVAVISQRNEGGIVK